MSKEVVGKITHFFPKVGVAVVKLEGVLKTGDKISIEKGDHIVEQTVDSMQVNHQNIPVAKPGDDVGMKTNEEVKPGAIVYKVTE